MGMAQQWTPVMPNRRQRFFRKKKKETAYSQRKRALCFPRRRIQYADKFVANDFSSPN
jgi:hypothetical protein